MSRHGNEFGSQCFQRNRQASGRLGRVHDKGNPPFPAAFCHLLHRQDIAKDIGNMGEYRPVRPPIQRLFPLRKGVRPVEELPAGHHHPGIQPVEGTGYRVVLKAGDHHPAAGAEQGTDGDIQSMGAVVCQHHLLRLAGKQLSCRLPAGVELLRCRPGCPIAAPSGIGAGTHGLRHRAVNLWGLMEGGGSVVQIDHSLTSSSCPSSF